MDPPAYVARICWNSKGWVYPTGEAAAAEAGTYATEMGFGHEEWLFNYEWILDGWKYGFLQPVGKSRAKLERRTIDVRLYTISPHAEWFYVGHLGACEVLDERTAAAARTQFKKRGWFKDMVEQLDHVGGNQEGLHYDEAVWVFNIRFKPSDAVLYDPMVPVRPSDAIRKLRRYTLVRLSDEQRAIEQEWRTRVGTTIRRPTGKQHREGVPAREVDLPHNQLQNELYSLLVHRFGRDAVEMESGFADIRLRRDGATVLFELKSDSRARYAIREAIGQLLEYGYVAQQAGERVTDLIVAGPGELLPADSAYLQYLREQRGLPIRYLCMRRGTTELDI